jgi:hypothetical protein
VSTGTCTGLRTSVPCGCRKRHLPLWAGYTPHRHRHPECLVLHPPQDSCTCCATKLPMLCTASCARVCPFNVEAGPLSSASSPKALGRARHHSRKATRAEGGATACHDVLSGRRVMITVRAATRWCHSQSRRSATWAAQSSSPMSIAQLLLRPIAKSPGSTSALASFCNSPSDPAVRCRCLTCCC